MSGFSVKYLICILHQVSKITNFLILLVQLIDNFLPLLFMVIFGKGKAIKACLLFLDNFLLLLQDFIKKNQPLVSPGSSKNQGLVLLPWFL